MPGPDASGRRAGSGIVGLGGRLAGAVLSRWVKEPLRLKAVVRYGSRKRYVRTLHDHDRAGGVARAVSLFRAAELPAALQRGADPAGADRADGRRAETFRAGALGIDPALGEGPARLHAVDQCTRRNHQPEAGVPQRHEAAALPASGRRLL